MLDMQMPWYEFIARGVIVYVVLLLLVRLSGKRTVGQFTPFDLLVVMLLSEAVTNSLTGGDQSLPGGLIVAATMVCLNLILAFASSRSARAEQIIDGSPVLIARDGQLFEQVMRAHRVSMGDIEKTLHESDCKLEDVKCAFLESDGEISILQKK